MLRSLARATLLLAIATVAGCSGDDFGRLSLSVTDAPVDSATSVVVTFTGVELKRRGESAPEVFTFNGPRAIDLLDLQGRVSEALFKDATVPAGDYEWIRLKVNAERGVIDSYIEFDNGAQYSLWVPSGAESGLKLVSGFAVPAAGSADFTIDFDLRKSVHDPQGNFSDYILQPALRLVDNAEAGAIAGSVAGAWVTAECEPVVYLFEGNGVTPDDVDGSDPEPVTSAMVSLDANGAYVYELGFVTAGEYTIAFSCDGDADAPDSDDAMSFIGAQNASVTANETTTLDFD